MSRALSPTPNTPAKPNAAQPRQRAAAISIDPIRLIRQNTIGIVVSLFGGAILGVILNYVFLYVYPIWSGTAYLEIRSQLESASDLNAKELGTEESVIRLAQTEVARMMSRENLKKALENNDVQKTQWSQSSWYRDENNLFNIDEAATQLEKDLRAGHKRGTQIFYISWTANVPEDVPVVLNAIADSYIKQTRNSENSRFAATLNVFKNNEDALYKQTMAKKLEIQDFVKQKGMTSLNEVSSENTRSLEKMRDGIAGTTSELSVAESRLDQAKKKQSNAESLSEEDLREADNDTVMINLNRDLEDLSRRYEAAKLQFEDTHAEVLQLKAARDSIVTQRNNKRDEVISRNKLSDLRGAINKVESLKSLLKKQIEEFNSDSKKTEEFTANMAELGTLREQLSQIEAQRKEVGQTINNLELARLRDESRRVEFIQKAIKPREITFPQLKFMIPGTAVVLCGLYVLILFIRELLDQRVKYPGDLVALPGRILGVIPDIADDPTKPKRAESVVLEEPHSMTAENFRQASALIAKGLAPTNAKIVLVISPMPDSGTTAIVINLAACEAAVGRKTLIVGANLRRPGLAKALGLNPLLPGLGDILNGTNPADTVVDIGNGLHFIGAGVPSNRSFQLLNTDKMDAFLDWCHQNYDRVFLDTPPSVVAGEGLALANKVDAAILVVRAWQDQKGLVAKLAYQLMECKCIFLGTILNRPKNTAGGYFKKNAEAIAQYAISTSAFQMSASGVAKDKLLPGDGAKPSAT